MRRHSPDFWSGLALAALGGYIVYQARGWEYLSADGPGPGFFPLWYGIAMLALSLALVFTGAKGAAPDWRGTGRALGAWAAFAICVAVLKLVGFAISFTALTLFIVAIMYRRGFVRAVLVAGLMAGAFYLVFPLALGVALP
jgi:putative tricarboxylic transport membrane protein